MPLADNTESTLRALRDPAGVYAIAGARAGKAAGAARELLQALATQPLLLAQAQAELALELARVALGRSTLRPAADDDRFADRAWQTHAVFRRGVQAHVAWSRMLLGLVEQLDLRGEHRARLHFAARHLIAATAPSNFFLTHPGFYDNAVKTRGRSVLAGIRHLVADLRDRGGMPRRVDRRAFRLGLNLAATEGAVIFRNAVFELIQYSPRTPSVDASGVLLCPPQINKYYLLDLSPENSFARHALESGQQVFAISWRNPTAAQSDWGAQTYVEATQAAVAAVRSLTGRRPVKLVGALTGGITAAATVARMTARGEGHKIACLSLLATAMNRPAARASRRIGNRAIDDGPGPARRIRSGVLTGRTMMRAHAWQNPDDLVWPFVVNNYVLGNDPPACDALYWNSDTTRVPARLNADLAAFYGGETRAGPRLPKIGDERTDVSSIARDVFMVAGANDPLVDWQGCYQALQMFHSNARFVLAAGGAIRAVLSPPGDEHACFYINDDYSLGPAQWRYSAHRRNGSWWPAWLRWCQAHGAERIAAPTVYGNKDFAPLEAAPGRYVRQY